MKIPFSPPFIDSSVEEEVLSSLRSGWITTGPKVRELEIETAKLCDTSHVLCCNSATSGLMLALHWFGVGRGDEVIIPAYTYCATALAVMHLGATPIMLDCGKDLNLDHEKLLSAISEKTKVIIPVDIAGWPCDYEAIQILIESEIVRRLFIPRTDSQRMLGRILILSDAAHSLGAEYKKRPAASWADITVLSFHAVKNVTTAEGGAICLNLPTPFENDKVYDILRLWSLNGQTKDAFSKSQGGSWRYDIVYPGFKMNMPDISAAIGLAQIRMYKQILLFSRRSIYKFYSSLFENYSWAEVPLLLDENRIGSAHIYPLRIKGINEVQRDAMIENITEQGVSVNVHFIPLPLLTVFRERGFNIKDYPEAYDQYSREISLPIYPQLSTEQVLTIFESVKNAYALVAKNL